MEDSMKLRYKVSMTALLLAGVLLLPFKNAVLAQPDTVLVEWANEEGQVDVNNLTNVIMNDSVEVDGNMQHRKNVVYQLRRGGFYQITSPITASDYHLQIVGNGPSGNDVYTGPPIIQVVQPNEGDLASRMLSISGSADMSLKGLWLTGATGSGSQSIYQPIYVNTSDSDILVDNCVITKSNFAVIAFDNGPNNDITYTNNVFRNLIGHPADQFWQGRAISIWTDQDSVIIENNTFFNINMTVLQVEGGAANYVRFNHNTIVNVGRSVTTGGWWREAYFTNNLLINAFWHGEGSSELTDPSRDPELNEAGIFGISDLPSAYGPEQGRRVALSNTAHWRDPYFQNNYYGDSIRVQHYLSNLAKQDYFDNYEQMTVQDTSWLSSNPLNNYPTDLNYANGTVQDSMVQCIIDLRQNNVPAQEYFWGVALTSGGEFNHQSKAWPLPEDFSYDAGGNDALMGTDGLPLGDLNWQSDADMQDFQSNKATYVDEIENLPGQRLEFEVKGTQEAEAGVVDGDAEVEVFDGFGYYYMTTGGYIEWTFDEAQGNGPYELHLLQNMEGNAERGEYINVNGTNLRNDEGFGEYYFSGIPTDSWYTVEITQDDLFEGGEALALDAEVDTIRIEKSWGYQSFASVDVVDAGGNTVTTLNAAEAEAAIVEPTAEGATYTPQGFQWVKIDGTGSIEWTFDVPETGSYRIQVYYQAPEGDQVAEIAMDGETVVSSLNLSSPGDSSGVDVLSSNFQIDADGSHNFTLSSSSANLLVDYVQLVKEAGTGTPIEHDRLPNGFTLEQNYPNPFNPSTVINYSIPKASNVQLTVFNVLGQRVATLVNQRMSAGRHSIQFNASRLASGVYFYRLKAGDFVTQKQMMLIK